MFRKSDFWGRRALPLPDLPLLRKVLSHIDVHPEEWHQDMYGVSNACGTPHCIAGHVVVLTGASFNRYGMVETDRYCNDSVPVSWYAQQKLGITDEEAWGNNGWGGKWNPGLFNGTSTRQDINKVAICVAARAGEKL